MPLCGYYCPRGGENLPFLCNFASHHYKTILQSCKTVSHHCIGHCTAAKRPRTTAKRIYSIAKRPRTIAKRFCSIVSCPCSGAGRDCTAIPSALLVAMEFGCLVKLGRHTTPLPIPNREVKPGIADDTALVGSAYVPSSRHSSCKHGSALDFRDSCGKVGRRQSF